MARVLIIDDDDLMCQMLSDLVTHIGHGAACAATLAQGMAMAGQQPFDVVFLDVCMPDGNGLDRMAELKALPWKPEIIIITGAGDMDGAELAIRNGAWDYLLKPIVPKEMVLPLRRVLQYRDSLEQSRPSITALNRMGIVGESQAILSSLDDLARAAASETNVLITGETGTGKELFARVVHRNSRRRQAPFVVVDCAALPRTLVTSHLFGHEKGAFTGADARRVGLVEQAHQGTLFLDEVGELPLELQKHFLRVLQEHRFRPVGGPEKTSDFRLVAATNRDLDQMVKTGKFREDLLYRIRSMTVEPPPLRKRKGDIQALVFHHMGERSRTTGDQTKGFSPDFFKVLDGYHWPGNVRELLHTLEAAIAMAGRDTVLFPKHLPDRLRIQVAKTLVLDRTPEPGTTPEGPTGDPGDTGDGSPGLPLMPYKAFRAVEQARADKAYFSRLMMETRGDIKTACRFSGLGRTRLYTQLKKCGISRTQWQVAPCSQKVNTSR